MRVNSSSDTTFGGLLYADGLSNGAKCPKQTYPNGAVKINLVGGWATWRPEDTITSPHYAHPSHPDPEKEVLGLIANVKMYQSEECGYHVCQQ